MNMEQSVTVRIVWNGTEQKKTFETLSKAIEWCRRNYKNIMWVNDYYTHCDPVSHFDLITMLLS